MTTVRVNAVRVLGVRRAVDLEKVEGLIESIRLVGLLNPITVTPDNVLIAGAHRLEAFRIMGNDEIPAVIMNLNGVAKELAEIDENFVRNDLTELQISMYLQRRKEIYEEIHPQTRKGGDPTTKAKILKENSALSFVKDTVRSTGRSETSIKESVKIGKGLSKPTIQKIKDTPIADNKEELKALADVPKQQQAKVVEKVLTGQADSVREAVKPVVKPVIVAVPKSQAQIRKERAEMLDAAVTAMLDLMPSVKSRNTIKETLELYEQFDSQADVISEALDYFEKGWKP